MKFQNVAPLAHSCASQGSQRENPKLGLGKQLRAIALGHREVKFVFISYFQYSILAKISENVLIFYSTFVQFMAEKLICHQDKAIN